MKINLRCDLYNGNENELIHNKFKNYVVTRCANVSPKVVWKLENPEDIKYIDHFRIFCYTDDLVSQRSYGLNNGFIYWYVDNISKNQTIDDGYGIDENGYWVTSDVVIYKTDFETGDKENGWNGPGNYVTGVTGGLFVEAVIKQDSISSIGSETVRSNVIPFWDFDENLPTVINNCGQIKCPEGFEYNSLLQKCIKEEQYKAGAWGLYLSEESEETNTYNVYDFSNDSNPIDLSNHNIALSGKSSETHLIHFCSSYDRELQNSVFREGIEYVFNLGIITNNTVDYTVPGNDYVYTFKSYVGNNDTDIRYNIKIIGVDNDFEKELVFIHNGFNKTQEPFFIGYIKFHLNEGEYKIILKAEKQSGAGDLSALSMSQFIWKYDNDSITGNRILSIPEYDVYCNNNDELDGNICIRRFIEDAEYTYCVYDVLDLNKDIEYTVASLIELKPDYIYNFSDDNNVFKDNETSNYDCVLVKQKKITNSLDDVINVNPEGEIGYKSSNYDKFCNAVHKFVSCDGEKSVITSLNSKSIIPEEGNVYNMSFCEHTGEFSHFEFHNEEFTKEYKKNCECYVYQGMTDETKTHRNLLVKNDYNSDDCGVCRCVKFRGCKTGRYILVKNFIDSEVGYTYWLVGNEEIEDDRWVCLGYDDCSPTAYDSIEIREKWECDSCITTFPYYKLTSCDGEKTVHIYYIGTEVLDSTKTYVLDGECYSGLTLETTDKCEPEEGEYVVESFDKIYDNCEQCNKNYLYLKTCETDEIFRVDAENIESYIGRYVKYEYNETVGCGLIFVEKFIEDEEEAKYITVLSCHDSCEDCLYVEPDPIKEFRPGRNVEPRHESKECCDVKEYVKCKRCDCRGKYRIIQ